jgi:hypothetical protein
MLPYSSFRRSTLSRLAFFPLSAALALALVWSALTPAFSQGHEPQRKSRPARTAPDIARGKYIVEDVAVCGQCHTPRDSNGNLDRRRWLQGGPVPYLPAKPDSNWPINAPRIGGTPPAPDADMIKLLTTGIWTTGNRLLLPMPQFRMERGDAEAVLAYLKSLTPEQ